MLEINYASSDYDARCPPTVWGHQGSLQVLVHSIVATRPRYNHSVTGITLRTPLVLGALLV